MKSASVTEEGSMSYIIQKETCFQTGLVSFEVSFSVSNQQALEHRSLMEKRWIKETDLELSVQHIK